MQHSCAPAKKKKKKERKKREKEKKKERKKEKWLVVTGRPQLMENPP